MHKNTFTLTYFLLFQIYLSNTLMLNIKIIHTYVITLHTNSESSSLSSTESSRSITSLSSNEPISKCYLRLEVNLQDN